MGENDSSQTTLYAALLRPELAGQHAYQPLHGQFALRLDANEAPSTFSAEIRAELVARARHCDFTRYPDAQQLELRRILAEHSGVTPSEIIAGVGSDEILALLMTAFCRAPSGRSVANVLTTTPTFVMYRMSAAARGLATIEVPLDAEWHPDTPAMLRAIQQHAPNLIFIASPNNPTGTRASHAALREIIRAAPRALVVIDEAYADYADGNARALYDEFPNVALLRTLSKIGFAALRVGWLIAKAECVALLDLVRLPYNLPTLSQQLAVLALSEFKQEIGRVIAEVRQERDRVTAALSRYPGVVVTPSDANFLWLRTLRPASEVHASLMARGILVRSFHEKGGRLANQLRVTLGTAAENTQLLRVLHEVT